LAIDTKTIVIGGETTAHEGNNKPSWFDGLIDEVRISNIARSASEISAHWAASIKEPLLIATAASDNINSVDGIDNDDFIHLSFDNSFSSPPVVTAATVDSLFPLSNSHSWVDGFGALGTAIWDTNNTKLTITLTTNVSPPTIAVGDQITFGDSGIPVTIIGSFDAPILPKIDSAVASDGGVALANLDSDDYVLIYFDQPVDTFLVNASNVNSLFPLSGSHTWLSGNGAIASALWNNGRTQLLINLDVGLAVPTVAVGDTISYASDNKILIGGNFGPPDAIQVRNLKKYGGFSVYPNPFNGSIKINYRNQNKMKADLKIYSLRGELIRYFSLNANGKQSINWNGENFKGNKVPSGVYLIQLSAGGKVFNRRVSLVR